MSAAFVRPASSAPPSAVAIRTRRTRQITLVLAALAAITLTGRWFFGGLPFVHSSSRSDSSKPGVLRGFTDLIPYRSGLPYGMTKQQMIHRLGTPEKIAGQCLQYPENLVAWNGRVYNAVRMCFFGGQYQGWFLEIDGIWNTPGIYKAIEPPITVTAVPLNKTIPDWSKLPGE